MSIKWKLSIAFILLSIGIVGLYIVIAKRTFESDKISYIFDSEQRQVAQMSTDFGEKVTRVVFDARAILSGYDVNTSALSKDSENLLKGHEAILAVDVRSPARPTPIAVINKVPGSTEILERLSPIAKSGGQIDVQSLGENRFVASVATPAAGEGAVLRVLFELKNLFAGASDDQTMLLTLGDQIMLISNPNTFPKESLDEFLKNRPSKDIASTYIRPINGKNYLISSSPVKVGNFQTMAFMSQDAALSALNVLYQRSLAFLAMSFFATVIISLFLSNSLTRNINELKRVAEKIGEGDFNATPDIKSKDEVGVLAGAFKRMGQEIQKLVLATADKARMEAELKTTALVQENFFPSKGQHQAGEFRVGGIYVTSTECGGDWWYYFEKNDYLYVVVADATGHGTPAAMSTAAARSMFSYIQTKELDLKEIATLCDDAIYQCSKGRVYMTAFLLKINVRSGIVTYINACHEHPYLYAGEEGSDVRRGNYVVSDPDSMFGETKHNWHEQTLLMKPGEKLIVYTDGITAVENLEKKTIPNRKIGKIFDAALTSGDAPETAAKKLWADFATYSQGQPLPDDITVVIIERLEAGISSANIEGELAASGMI